MAPLLAIAALMYSKKQKEAEERRAMTTRLLEQRAAQLGGPTAGIEAADFNRRQGMQNFLDPQTLMAIFGGSGGGGASSYVTPEILANRRGTPDQPSPAGNLSDYGASFPRTQADALAKRRAREAELIDPWNKTVLQEMQDAGPIPVWYPNGSPVPNGSEEWERMKPLDPYYLNTKI